MTSQPVITRTTAEFQTAVAQALATAQREFDAQATDETPAEAARLGFVPTMGALHNGHATLMRRAREQNAVVAISIFVNPLQFGPDEDFEKYPRTLEADAQLAGEAGVDIIFAPDVEEMYPGGSPLITVSSGSLGGLFEGKTRPGHFDGALTVVNKFFNILEGCVGNHEILAYFGQKDAQQLSLMQRMVTDFNHPVTIKPVAIVREDNGLALSSRNQYLSDQEKEAALVLSRTLALLREQSISRGFENLDLKSARDYINNAEGVRLDYLEVVDPENFVAPTENSKRALALVAAYVGDTRLIDNMELS
ncbi:MULTISPECIES: pantoate--beta-alanine ligase [unclassified Rothia (in: high G+C Gram-positive bacteria)]|uniref:pantoate--beta-alanine ligase n=1 Tax=unclassified Rothia (in: high G+C Gram-positive bacteria) TaxID=2689056 RepID=UPI00195A9BB0|nr:pantoate--beta-alanine ligase [Rothia sp. ZJ932]MBM7051607.1 pantoate--beta-alanine ligase [Rothia sp. ZJ1223]QRZ61758.1 pantoate--beta-alanine ligase [Rothia sp. ZJ932]